MICYNSPLTRWGYGHIGHKASAYAHAYRGPTSRIVYSVSFSVLDHSIASHLRTTFKVQDHVVHLLTDRGSSLSEVMSKTLSFATHSDTILYKIAFDDTADYDTTSNIENVSTTPQEYWWEEVDRVYPLVYTDSMSSDHNSGTESNPAKDSETLEQHGVHPGEKAGSTVAELQRGQRGEQDDQGGETSEQSIAGRADVDGKKRRRRSTSQRNQAKKNKTNPEATEAGTDKSTTGKPAKPRKGRKPVETDAQKKQKQDQLNRQAQQREQRQQRLALREQAQGRSTPQRSPKHASNARPSGTPRMTNAFATRSPVPGQNPGNPLLRPPVFAQSPLGMGARPQRHPTPGQEAGDMSAEGIAREQHRMRLLMEHNPVPEPVKKKQKARVPDDFTFEITYPDMQPIHEDFMVAADMLGEARMKADKEKNRNRAKGTPKIILKIDSRKLRSGDWIVMAEDCYTKTWLTEYFATAEFKEKFTATLVSERGDTFNYSIKIQPPDSRRDNDELMAYILEDVEEQGYWRINNESRFYKDKDNSGETNKAYHKSLKKGTPFDDHGVPYVKTLWLRMNALANEVFEADPTDLNIYFRSGKIEIDKVKDKKKKKQTGESGANVNGSQSNRNDEEMNGQEPQTGGATGNAGDDDQEMIDEHEEDVSVIIQTSEGVDDDVDVGPEQAGGTRRE